MVGRATRKRWFWHAVRLGVCVLALWWVLEHLAWAGILAAWRGSDKHLLAVAFVVFLPAPVIQAARFEWMLRAQGIAISLWQSLKLSYTGAFFNLFVPAGSVGGDVVKAYYAAQHTSLKTEAVAGVLLDRVLGLAGFLLFGAVGFAIKLDERTHDVGWLIGGMLVCLAFAGVLIVSRSARGALGVERMASHFPFADKVKRLCRAALRLRECWSLSIAAVIATLVSQVFILGAFSVAAIALGMRGDVVAYFACLSVSLVVAAIPISPGGLGTMEAAMMFFLVGADLGGREQVILLALTMRAIQLFWALPGGVTFLTGACRPDPVKLARLQAEMVREA